MKGKTVSYNLGRGTLAIFTTLSISAIVLAQSSDLFDDAFRAMKRDDKLQFELPPAPEPPKLGWLENFFKGLAKDYLLYGNWSYHRAYSLRHRQSHL